MITVLLTGSEGYIGQNFYRQYKDKYNFIKIDKKLGERAEEFVDFDNIDYIIHLAAISGILDCEEDPDKTFVDNVSATLHLMKGAWAHNIPMIFASSQCAKTPTSSLYAATKRIGEVEAMRYKEMFGDIKCLRFSNIYGGYMYKQKKKSVVAKFLNAKAKNESLIIHGDGSQTRDFVHVDEICKVIDMCLSVKLIPFPIDVGTGIERSVREVAEIISDNIVYEEERDVGSSSSIADVKDLKEYIGYVPQDKLTEYIQNE